MKIFSKNRVPEYKLKPDPVASFLLILVLIIGALASISFFQLEDGSGVNFQRGVIATLITGLLVLFLTLAATAKYWFSHLWKKNATHNRHRMHTRNHPSKIDEAFINKKRKK